MTGSRPTFLSGWGATVAVGAHVAEPRDLAETAEVLAASGSAGAIARGLGRSYGDAAQRAGGTVVSSSRLRDPIVLQVSDDGQSASVTAGAGWSLRDLLEPLVGAGWFLPVVPGTADISVGGAIAADVHGKNHHRDGSFGAHVEALDLVAADGEGHELAPTGPSAELFWATVGGMGLTGVVVRATIRLMPIVGADVAVTTTRTRNLDHTMRSLTEADTSHAYTVAWLDLAATQRLGRGIVQAADPVESGASNSSSVASPTSRRRLSVPSQGFNVVRPAITRAFNSAWWRLAPSAPTTKVMSYGAFLHPLDAVSNWNRLYGKRGFVQWQMVVPTEAHPTIAACAARLAVHEVPPSLVVLKRFGEANPAPLSFPMPGWTLAVDLPTGNPSTATLLDELDELVADVGGRIYLAKDARCRPDGFARMYPRLKQWQAQRAVVDPTGVMASDLSRRLGLTD